MATANLKLSTYSGKRSISEVIFKFILLDVLFFPYPPELPVTFGVLAAIAWPLFSLNRANKRYFILTAALIVLTILSFLRFMAFSPVSSSMYFVPNAINAGILCYMAVLVLSTVSTLGKERGLELIYGFTLFALKGYILFKAVLAMSFFLSPTGYFRIRSLWTLSGNTIEIGDLNSLTRFTGTLSDPNNFACLMAAVVAFVIFRQPEKLMQNIGILLLASISIVASMSVTGIASFFFVVAIYATFARFRGQLATRVILKLLFALMLPVLFLILYQIFQDHPVIQFSLQRVLDSSGDSRIAKLAILADADRVISALIIGEGGVIIWNGERFSPHIGHIYILLGYGLPAYVLFLFVFFPVSSRASLGLAVFLIPIFLGFSMNVGIYEPRFAGLWALLVGLYALEPRGRSVLFKQRRTPQPFYSHPSRSVAR